MRTMALKTFKIVSKSSLEFIQNIIKIKENSYNFSYQNTVDVPRPRTIMYGKKGFSYKVATLKNSLPHHERSLSFFGQFKHFISTWYFSENCTCSSCKVTCFTGSELSFWHLPFAFIVLNMLFMYVLCLSFIYVCILFMLCDCLCLWFVYVCMYNYIYAALLFMLFIYV